MLNIVIFGAPGSGKGTQSDNLIKTYGLFHISTGDVLRDHIKRGTELGTTAKAYIADKASKGVIFDGFPRTIAQAEALEKMLKERNTGVSAVVGLEVPEDELVERLIKRGKESGRSDDNLETIKGRLQVYHSQTSPLQDFYKQKGLYKAIKGTGSIDGIFADIKAAVDAVL